MDRSQENALKNLIAYNIASNIMFDVTVRSIDGTISAGFLVKGDEIRSLVLLPLHTLIRIHESLIGEAKKGELTYTLEDGKIEAIQYFPSKQLSQALKGFKADLASEIHREYPKKTVRISIFRKVWKDKKSESINVTFTTLAAGWLIDDSGEHSIAISDLPLQKLLMLQNQCINGVKEYPKKDAPAEVELEEIQA